MSSSLVTTRLLFISSVFSKLQRHGARYPTSGPGADIASAVSKLQNVTTYNDSSLDFIRNFTFNLGTNGDLVLYGAAQYVPSAF